MQLFKRLIAAMVISMIIPGLSIQGKELSKEVFLKNYFKTLFKTDEVIAFPIMIRVSGSSVYLADIKQCKINRFNKDGKLLMSFGSQGSGPKEFDDIRDLAIVDNSIYVTCMSKISIFTRDGKFIKEIRSNMADTYLSFIPAKDCFIGMRRDFKGFEKGIDSYIFGILTPGLKKTKDIVKIDFKRTPNFGGKKENWLMFHNCRKGVVYKDRLYVGCTDKGFYIGVYDIRTGKMQYEIDKEYDKIPITSVLKDRVMTSLKSMHGEEGYKKILNTRNIIFPDYLPAFVNFFIENDKIYIFEFPKPGSQGMSDVLILDMKGNLLKRSKFLVGSLFFSLESPKSHSFNESKVYFVFPDQKEDDIIDVFYIDIAGIVRDGY